MIILYSCQEPGGGITPAQDACNFSLSGKFTFSEMKLYYLVQDAPTNWQVDHDGNHDGYLYDFTNILTLNYSASNDDSYIDFTMTGINCDGEGKSKYTKDTDPIDYSIALLKKHHTRVIHMK